MGSPHGKRPLYFFLLFFFFVDFLVCVCVLSRLLFCRRGEGGAAYLCVISHLLFCQKGMALKVKIETTK